MQQIVTLLHIFAALSVIGLVLMQRGKGSDMGASFGAGGASGTMFGSQGSTPFLVKLTGILAMVFFVTSATLSFILSKYSSNASNVPVGYEQPMKGSEIAPPIQNIPTTSSKPAQQSSNTPPISLMNSGSAVSAADQGSSSALETKK